MTPRKTAAGTYEVRWRERNPRTGKETRRKVTKPTRKEAVEFIQNLAAEKARDRDAAKRSFSEYADTYLSSLDCKPRTIAGYKSQLKPAREFFGTAPVGTLTASDARAYLTHLRELMAGNRTRSIRSAWRTFVAVLDVAVDDDALVKNPARNKSITPPTANSAGEQKFKPNFLRPQDIANLAAQLPHPYGLLVQFAAYTGLRRGEIAALDMQNPSLTATEQADGSLLWGGVVIVNRAARRKGGEWLFDTPKSARSTRTVPLPSWLAERLHDYQSNHPFGTRPDAPLFPGRRKGGSRGPEGTHGAVDWATRWEPESWCRNVFAPAVETALPGQHVRFHDLRHTFASLCAAEGIKAQRVSVWMGHATPSFTLDVYTHLFRGEEDALAVQALAAPPAPLAPREPVAKVTRLHTA